MGKHVINPDQLQLFTTFYDLRRRINWSEDQQFGETLKEMWGRKERQAKVPEDPMTHGSGVYDSLKEHGFDPNEAKYPWHQQITLHFQDEDDGTYINVKDGHHRIAAAEALEREGKTVYFPVDYKVKDLRTKDISSEPL